jgi:hypothetical protein
VHQWVQLLGLLLLWERPNHSGTQRFVEGKAERDLFMGMGNPTIRVNNLITLRAKRSVGRGCL